MIGKQPMELQPRHTKSVSKGNRLLAKFRQLVGDAIRRPWRRPSIAESPPGFGAAWRVPEERATVISDTAIQDWRQK